MLKYGSQVLEDKDYKRNYILLFLDNIMFTNAMTFLSVNAVIAYYLNTLGASTLQISLSSALVSIGAFATQPIFAKKAMENQYKLGIFAKALYIQRFVFLVYILTIPFLAKSNPSLSIILFLVFWFIFSLFTGVYSPFYMSLLSKMIPHSEQGKLLGFAGAMGNIIAIGSSYLIGTILKKVSFPYNYTIIFAIGIFILLLDVVDFQLMKEMPDEITDKQMNFFEYIKDIPNILRSNTNVLKIVIGNCFIIISNVSLGYYALYAIRTYNAQAEQVALFTGIAVTVNILGSAAFGLMADRFGHKSVLKIASMLGGIAGVIVLGIPSIYAVYIAFALSTLCLNGYNLSSGVIIVHNSPKTQVPVYISANNMITLIVSSVAMVASGYIIDKVSFTPIFMVIGFAGFIGFIVFNIISVNK